MSLSGALLGGRFIAAWIDSFVIGFVGLEGEVDER